MHLAKQCRAHTAIRSGNRTQNVNGGAYWQLNENGVLVLGKDQSCQFNLTVKQMCTKLNVALYYMSV